MFEENKIKKLEREAAINIEISFESTDSNKLDNAGWKKRVEKIWLDYIALKEKFKHDKKKLLEIAIDWKDFAAIFSENQTACEIRIFAGGGNEKNDKLIEETEIRMGVIEKKFSRFVAE